MSRLIPSPSMLLKRFPAVLPRTRALSSVSSFESAVSNSAAPSPFPSSSQSSSRQQPLPSAPAALSPSATSPPPLDPHSADPSTELLAVLARLIMQDGKLARAHAHLDLMLSTLQLSTSSPPLPILERALALTSPSIRMVGRRKGTKVLQTPQPLTDKQRRRQAWLWIVEASDKRQGAEKSFGKRLAQEVLAVVNGQSEALKNLEARHRQGVTGRANVGR
ncbi:hypothetical protein JCM21900_006103 [Sporobolomyces salmonicolor]